MMQLFLVVQRVWWKRRRESILFLNSKIRLTMLNWMTPKMVCALCVFYHASSPYQLHNPNMESKMMVLTFIGLQIQVIRLPLQSQLRRMSCDQWSTPWLRTVRLKGWPHVVSVVFNLVYSAHVFLPQLQHLELQNFLLLELQKLLAIRVRSLVRNNDFLLIGWFKIDLQNFSRSHTLRGSHRSRF